MAYKLRKQYSFRPANFTLDYGHPLAEGLVFAGLGANAGSKRYQDSSVFGNHGERQTSGSAWNIALGRNTFNFPGADITYRVEVPDNDLFTPSDDTFTACGWLYMTASGFFPFWFAKTYQVGWGCSFNADTRIPRIYIDGQARDAATALSLDTWTHLAYQHNGSNSRIYINGEVDLDTALVRSIVNDSYPLTIGNTYLSDGQVSGYYYYGDLADVMFYNRILSPSEIQQLADPSNIMIDNMVIPLPDKQYWPGITLGPPPTPTRKHKIFKSSIIRGAA